MKANMWYFSKNFEGQKGKKILFGQSQNFRNRLYSGPTTIDLEIKNLILDILNLLDILDEIFRKNSGTTFFWEFLIIKPEIISHTVYVLDDVKEN